MWKKRTYYTIIERECLKIGVVYVNSEAVTQCEILRTVKGSENYEKFLKYLGEKIKLDKHLGYKGGLKYNLDGNSTIYYSDVSIEVIFHVSTLMPNSEDDEQQINKKKFNFFNFNNKYFNFLKDILEMTP